MPDTHNLPSFHAGEIAIQKRLGLHEQMEGIGQQVIRDHLTNQQREFFAELEYLLIASIDSSGKPWASMVVGHKGFVHTPDAQTLIVDAPRVHGDPLAQNVQPGAHFGVLGIQFETRRRNRMAGTLIDVGDNSLTIEVKQTFGNCPRYIQARSHEVLPDLDTVGTRRDVTPVTRLDGHAAAIVARADHFFIATHNVTDADTPTSANVGADVSHRGGKPGFVRLDDNRHLTFPDFAGNRFFNTLGNITRNPHAGMLFVDIESGDLLTLTGSANIIWEGAALNGFEGAERLVRLTVETGYIIRAALPIRWRLLEYSPFLEATGVWPISR